MLSCLMNTYAPYNFLILLKLAIEPFWLDC